MTAPTLHAVTRPPSGFDPAIESDGLTLDTEHGPVDLVAVQRALSGERLHLTRAEHKYVAALIRAHLAVYPTRKAA
ncbi:hypothetical protein KGA66_27075 [Actinocrinis puniceicyclus]|uniref:Uncharacterized protein n=1 Tax=Actinocrinis puniceicyclus TaxID=977794 RepID=A0A8J8BHF2_9ACTN|nr:hypothetical protein [Actinocrinis puniceicyclus]MBS2966729.1 hypothetical protein [Actinocrinis puniceicyclus]